MASVDRALQEAIHRRILAGDPVARSELFTRLLEPLLERLAFRWPRLRGSEGLTDQAIDSIMRYVSAPGRFDPRRASLLHYLVLDAQGDLINAYRRPALATESLEVVELDPVRRKRLGVVTDHYPSSSGAAELIERVKEILPDPRDQKVVALMANGERSTVVFADALGLSDRTPSEKRRLVKQAKDRIKKRLDREVRP